MEKLIHYYNQNRKTVWGAIIIIIFVLLLIQLFNWLYKQNTENLINNSSTVEENILQTNSSTVTSNRSAVSGEQLSELDLQNATTIIDNFITYCNNKDLQSAYDLLTDECKSQMYKTVEEFTEGYYNNVFEGETRIATIENWVNNIYKVRFTEDILATGNLNNGYAKQDYITVTRISGEYKLNINNYIGYTNLNKQLKTDALTMQVVSKNTYMEYEEYSINIKNNTQNTVLLDSMINADTIYLQDSKDVKYSSYNHELTEAMLTIEPGQTKELTIKFYSSYTSTKVIENIVFSDIILNYQEYMQLTNKNTYEKYEMRIEL